MVKVSAGAVSGWEVQRALQERRGKSPLAEKWLDAYGRPKVVLLEQMAMLFQELKAEMVTVQNRLYQLEVGTGIKTRPVLTQTNHVPVPGGRRRHGKAPVRRARADYVSDEGEE